MTKVVSTRISETEHKKFLDKCNEKGCNSADILRDLVISFLETKEESNTKVKVTHINDKPIPEAKDVKVIWE